MPDIAELGIAVRSAEAEQNVRRFTAATKEMGAQAEKSAATVSGGWDKIKKSGIAAGLEAQYRRMAEESAKAARLVGGAFLSMLSPVSLVTAGIAAATAAVMTYSADAFGAVNNLDQKLKVHADLIRSLRDAYGDAGKGVDTAVNDSANVLKTLLSLSTADLQKQLKTLTQTAVTSVSAFETLGDAVGMTIESTAPKFTTFKAPIDDLREGLKNGTPEIKAFREAVSRIIDGSPEEKVRKLGKELLDAVDAAYKIEAALGSAGKAMRGFSADVMAALEQGESFAKAMKALGNTVSPDISTRERILQNYSAALEKAGSTEERMAAMRSRDDQLAILGANERKKASEDAARSAEAAAKRFENILSAASRQNAGIDGKIAGVGKGVGELAKLETQYRLTEAAQQAFGKVTPQVAANIEKVADAAGRARQELAFKNIWDQVNFDQMTAGLSDLDRQIAATMKTIYGPQWQSHMDDALAKQMRMNDAVKQLNDVSREAFTGFVSGVMDGNNAMTTIGGAVNNLAAKLAQQANSGQSKKDEPLREAA